MPRPKDLPCCTCGAMMVRFSNSLPSGQAKCQPCRNIERPPRIRPHCMDCGTRMNTTTTAANAAVARCMACRQANQKNLHACTDCGVIRYVQVSRADSYRCHGCRRLRPTVHPFRCEQCGTEFHRRQGSYKYRFCSKQCVALAQTIRHPDDWHSTRSRRENNAPGLPKSKRTKLLKTWQTQQRPCAYCPQLADTVDHVMPLVRGGTNYEGNLVPCCRKCNSSKSGKTIIEWRHGVTLGKVKESAEWMGRPPRVKVPKVVKPPTPPHDCPICQTATTRPVYCSRECSVERTSRDLRDRYRAAHGLPVDRNQPVNKRATQPTFSLFSG